MKTLSYFRNDSKPRDDAASLHLAERIFYILASLYEKLFYPIANFLKGSLMTVAVLRRARSVTCEFW